MATFYATAGTNNVGSSTDLVPLPSNFGFVDASSKTLLLQYASTYEILTGDSAFSPTTKIESWVHYKSSTPFAVGAGEVESVWKAAPGDDYSGSEILTMLSTPGTTPGFTAVTEQDVNQFWFKFDDFVHGSDENDKLCGWAGKDKMWGELGDDEFYYGAGMGKDQIMDLEKKKDMVIFDTDLAKNFKALKKDVKVKSDKVVIKFDSSDKLVVHGIDSMKQLKKVAAFDDFTDFS